MTREQAIDIASEAQDEEVLVTRAPEVKGGWAVTILDTGEYMTEHFDEE